MLSRLWRFLAVSCRRSVSGLVSQPPSARPLIPITDFGAVPDGPPGCILVPPNTTLTTPWINYRQPNTVIRISRVMWEDRHFANPDFNPFTQWTEGITADPRTPKFAKPLAPLADWMQ